MLAEQSPSLNPATKMHKLWIIERGGTLLVHSGHPEMVMRDIRKRDKTCNECHFSFDYIETILGKAEGTIEYQIKGESKKIAAFTPMTFEKTSWIIVMNAPLDEVTAFEWNNLKETLFLLGTVAFLLGLAFFTTYRNYRQKVVGEMEVRHLRGQQKLMDTLRESEENYRNLVENASEAIFVAQDGKLVFINPMTTKMVGFSGEDLLSRSFVEFIHPDDRGMVLDRHHRRIKGEELPHIYSFRIIRGDGNVIWVELNTVVVN
jgi:PAS domain S-box-containing protein